MAPLSPARTGGAGASVAGGDRGGRRGEGLAGIRVGGGAWVAGGARGARSGEGLAGIRLVGGATVPVIAGSMVPSIRWVSRRWRLWGARALAPLVGCCASAGVFGGGARPLAPWVGLGRVFRGWGVGAGEAPVFPVTPGGR